MDPQAFVRLSVGHLGLRIPESNATKAVCEIRLRGFPVQTAPVTLVHSLEFNSDPHTNAIVFSLDESDLKALVAPGCFRAPRPYLEVVVYLRRRGAHCVIVRSKQLVGMFRVNVGTEWRDGKPVLLHHGWIGIGKKSSNKTGPELHLRVKLEPDPRYVFQFEDEIALSPQIVQLQGSIRQPIFSCKFMRGRRTSEVDSLGGHYRSSSSGEEKDMERRERKGWKVMIHDLSGSAVAAAFMATPFVPSTGCDRVARSNPGAWLIVRADGVGAAESWHPWGRLEAWREAAHGGDAVCLRLHLLPDGQDARLLVSEALLSSEKGGEFVIDMDRPQAPAGAPAADGAEGCLGGGFVMSCRVQGQAKSSKPVVQLAMRHVACMEDAAMFMALAAAVDLSVKACRPFRRKAKKGSPDPLETY